MHHYLICLRALASGFHISEREVLGKCRDQPLFFARIAIAFQLLNRKTKKQDVARLLNRSKGNISYYVGLYHHLQKTSSKMRLFEAEFINQIKKETKQWRILTSKKRKRSLTKQRRSFCKVKS